MSIQKTIDYSGLHGLIAEKIMTDWGMDATGRAVLEGLVRQGATPKQVAGEVLRILPTWDGRANQLEVVIAYLQNGGGE